MMTAWQPTAQENRQRRTTGFAARANPPWQWCPGRRGTDVRVNKDGCTSDSRPHSSPTDASSARRAASWREDVHVAPRAEVVVGKECRHPVLTEDGEHLGKLRGGEPEVHAVFGDLRSVASELLALRTLLGYHRCRQRGGWKRRHCGARRDKHGDGLSGKKDKGTPRALDAPSRVCRAESCGRSPSQRDANLDTLCV